MKIRILTLIFCLGIFPNFSNGQTQYQYFDGANTNPEYSLFIGFQSEQPNIWQIGTPQKNIFNAAATLPNALLTDSINYIPTNNASSFYYQISPSPWNNWGVLAIQWKQKIDMDFGKDVGLIEFSNNGSPWQNAFDSPYVYSFYGYDTNNVDTLSTGEIVFTGTDETWKDIWLCYDISWLNANGSNNILVRHTILCDSIDNNNEGWMIDNLMSHNTLIHTVNEVKQKDYLTVSPNPSTGPIEIWAQKINEYHIIEEMELLDASGKILDTWKLVPTKFFIDISTYSNGVYYLRIQTNKKSEVVKVLLQK